ncbi:prenylated flavin chaperone LpdD [Loigolactobacillus jiayinensis]|uniref:Amino acid decarboxylase n=1 Tax=Loigolactobacillus jiayinensis TaxID=2486016 RepID=A0ABW1RCD9_9LACO|nr:amino acid decarboxylase [Loigolactobacillus jiayinensis]
MSNVTFSVSKSGYTMTVLVQQIGPDLLLTIIGGDHPHIGTVTTFSATTPLTTVRFPSHDGRVHKDDVLAQTLAQQLKAQVSGSCTITAGVHVDQISQQQIKAAAGMAQNLGQQVSAWLVRHPVTKAAPQYYSDQEQPR